MLSSFSRLVRFNTSSYPELLINFILLVFASGKNDYELPLKG